MEKKHAADIQLPKWLDDLAEGKMIKRASPEEDAFVPYGMSERDTQLGNQSFENFVTGLIREDEGEAKIDEKELEDDQKLKDMEEGTEEKEEENEEKQTGPGGHIPDRTGPHGLGMGPGKGLGDGSGLKVVKEMQDEDDEEKQDDSPVEEPKDETPKEDIPDLPPDEEESKGEEPKDEDGDEAGSEIDELKKGLEELGEVKDFESRLKRIENLLENLQTPATADANENDSIFQSASFISDLNRSKRIIRRANAGEINKKDVIKKLNKIFSKF